MTCLVSTILSISGRFIKDFAKIARPLLDLTKKDAWTPECQAAFDKLKAHLTGAEIMRYQLNEGG